MLDEGFMSLKPILLCTEVMPTNKPRIRSDASLNANGYRGIFQLKKKNGEEEEISAIDSKKPLSPDG